MNIAVVGAGIGGMAAAYDLVKQGHKVIIYEGSDAVGGLAKGFKDPSWDWSVEHFYHHWFTSDNYMLGLIDELGLTDQLVIPRPLTVMYHKEKFYPFDSIPAAIMYPGLGWGITKIRFGLVTLYLRITNNWKTLEKFTIDEWMRKWAGSKAYEEMWEPMVIGKFGEEYARQVTMAWLWARLHARTTRLATFRGGFQEFSNKFAEKLRQLGVDIQLSTIVNQIKPAEEGGLNIISEGKTVHFDKVLVTSSPAALSRLAPDLPEDYLKGLLSLKSLGAVVMTVALKHQLSEKGYYWFNLPKKAGFPFLALVEHTNFLSPEYFGGDHIVYMGDYLPVDHEYFRLSKEELLERFMPALKRINPNFTPEWVRASWLHRENYAQPIPLVDHSKNIPAIETPLPGLYFASMSQVYPWDRGTNFAVEIAKRAVRIMVSQ
ncbi:MAG: NAD(P)/FAD-dependent oxidoreductase [Anaerolineaceae bacterium]